MRFRLLSLIAALAVALVLLAPGTGGSWSEWQFHTLYRFAGGDDGVFPAAPLIADARGVLYGTTEGGGNACPFNVPGGCGTVFEFEPPSIAGGQWKESVLYAFTYGTDGAFPNGALVEDASGSLYGVTRQGAVANCGTIFKLTRSQGGTYVESTLYAFTGNLDGCAPVGALVLDAAGNLYGESLGASGTGTVFELAVASPLARKRSFATKSASPTFETLHTFSRENGDGIVPNGGLLYRDGALYGTTLYGGPTPYPYGIVFELSPPAKGGTAWAETVIYAFTSTTDGKYPQGPLLAGSRGTLAGTTYYGGPYCRENGGQGCGTVFELRPPGHAAGRWMKHTLYSFGGTFPSSYPFGGLVADGRGRLYGAAFGGPRHHGVAFRITPPATGYTYTYTNLVGLTKDDAYPSAGLARNGATLYGTTNRPTTNLGTIYALDFQ